MGSEWRTFANGESKDRSRVGAIENALLDGADLSTTIDSRGLRGPSAVDEYGRPLYKNRSNVCIISL